MNITGTLVQLVPFEAQHITERYLAWLNDTTLMRYSRQRFVRHTYKSSLEYLEGFLGSPHQFWAILNTDRGDCIGTMTAYLDEQDGTADMGILIGHESARSKGYGREAWGVAMDYLFRRRTLRKITGGTLVANQPMVRVFLYWGMYLEGVRREQQVVEGEPMDMLEFGLLARHWLKRFPTPIALVDGPNSP